MKEIAFKKNIIANYVGQAWIALMSFAFIPLYVKYLGAEAYGLVGIFAMFQVWFSLLDIGMTPTISREMANLVSDKSRSKFAADLLRSVEIVAVLIGCVSSLGIWLCSDWLASNWLQFEDLSNRTVANALGIMGMVAALRLLENVYRSSLIGLQRQVKLNIILSVGAGLKGLGAVGILIWVSPTILAFFVWQSCISVFLIVCLSSLTYRVLLIPLRSPKFSVDALRRIKNFAGGVAVITLLSLMLTQVDKVVLSKVLSLEEFGYYSIANVVAGSLYLLINPINQALFPKFSELVYQDKTASLTKLFHQGSQLITVLVGSAAVTLICFGPTILKAWMQDEVIALKVSPI